MKLLWPDALWLMTLVPAFLAAYGVCVRADRLRRNASLQAFASALGPARTASPISLLLFSAGIALGVFSLSRPHASVVLPVYSARVVLALDVSASMAATDVGPRRFDAAKEIAAALVAALPAEIQVGLVSFAQDPVWVLGPTHNKGSVIAAIERLDIKQGTAVGTGIALALAMLYPGEGIDPDALPFGQAAAWPRAHANSGSLDSGGRSHVPARPDESAAVVLITDGQSSAGAKPLEAARLAAAMGVRIYPIGIGTSAGQQLRSNGWSMRVGLDESTLREIARTTRGEYSQGDAKAVARIHEKLESRLTFETHPSEITGLFALATALLIAASALLSVRRHKRIL